MCIRDRYENILRELFQNGYRKVSQVEEHGEYATRGSLLDIYPMGTNKPLRIEIYDDSIESLRYFNTDTQLTEKKIVAIDILPAKEIPLDEKSIRYFRSCYREKFEGNPTDSQLYLDISNGISHGGIEYYLPLFFDNTATFFDYFSKDNLIIAPNNLIDILTKYWTDIKTGMT